MPLGQRMMHLAQTLQYVFHCHCSPSTFTSDDRGKFRFGWFVGHLTLLFCSLRYSLSYIFFKSYSRWARFSYRTAFVAAAATYGIVVYKAFRARARSSGRQQPGGLALLGDENVQYLRKLPYPALLPKQRYS